MSPVDRIVFAWTQAVIEYERASFRHSAPQRVLVQLAGFLCGISAEYFDMIADFMRSLLYAKFWMIPSSLFLFW